MVDPNVERENMAKGCVRAVALALLFWAVVILLWMSSCVPARIYTEPKGTVLMVEGNAVKVGFPVIHKDEIVGVSVNWFYFREGHGYRINDVYPEPFK